MELPESFSPEQIEIIETYPIIQERIDIRLPKRDSRSWVVAKYWRRLPFGRASAIFREIFYLLATGQTTIEKIRGTVAPSQNDEKLDLTNLNLENFLGHIRKGVE